MGIVKEWQKELKGAVYSIDIDSQDNVYTGDRAAHLTKFSSDGTQIWQKN